MRDERSVDGCVNSWMNKAGGWVGYDGREARWTDGVSGEIRRDQGVACDVIKC